MMHDVREAAIGCEAELENKTGRAIKAWPRSPSGAGYIAGRMHESSETPRRKPADGRLAKGKNYLPDQPDELMRLANEAYYGGHFEISRTGLISGPVCEYDINSAYPSAMLAFALSAAHEMGTGFGAPQACPGGARGIAVSRRNQVLSADQSTVERLSVSLQNRAPALVCPRAGGLLVL